MGLLPKGGGTDVARVRPLSQMHQPHVLLHVVLCAPHVITLGTAMLVVCLSVDSPDLCLAFFARGRGGRRRRGRRVGRRCCRRGSVDAVDRADSVGAAAAAVGLGRVDGDDVASHGRVVVEMDDCGRRL